MGLPGLDVAAELAKLAATPVAALKAADETSLRFTLSSPHKLAAFALGRKGRLVAMTSKGVLDVYRLEADAATEAGTLHVPGHQAGE